MVNPKTWSWTCTGADQSGPWHLTWSRADELLRHLGFVDETGNAVFPYDSKPLSDRALKVEPSDGRPLSTIEWRTIKATTKVGLFESLGRLISTLHNLPAPAGFGDALCGEPYGTFNGFMAAEFAELGRAMEALDDQSRYLHAVDALATLRHELSAFHPHGKSTWTAGRLKPASIAVGPKLLRVEAIVELGVVALRPFEYDLAALSLEGLIFDDPLADRAFWKGYGAAVTCDLKRRVRYFERLIALERLLDRAAFLDCQHQQSSSSKKQPTGEGATKF